MVIVIKHPRLLYDEAVQNLDVAAQRITHGSKMAENRPESRVFLSVKIVDNRLVVSNGDESGNTVPVYILGTKTETDKPSQQAANDAQGKIWSLTYVY